MPKLPLTERVNILEKKVEDLETLTPRVTAVELQIVQLRDEMLAGFSAVRGEIRAVDESLRTEMRALHAEALNRIDATTEDTRRYMRVLHEEVISRIALLHEERRPRKKR